MRQLPRKSRRQGAVIPLVALGLVALLGMVALAVDLTLIMIARNQAQAAADTAALTGARTLNGTTANSANNNYSAAQTNAKTAAKANSILQQQITDGQVGSPISIGDYYYNYSTNAFVLYTNQKGSSSDNWNVCQVTVNFNSGPSFFSTVFGMNGFNTGATTTSAHRPRDIVVVQDYSSSMRLDSMMGMPKNTNISQSMLPLSGNDGMGNAQYPLFGQYSNKANPQFSALDYPPSGPPTGYYVNDTGELCSPGNLVTSTSDGDAIVNYYYSDATAMGSSTKVFSAAPTSYATTPGGDQWMSTSKNTSGTYATTLGQIIGTSASPSTTWDLNWELDGYAAYSGGVVNSALNNQTDYSTVPYNGYTQGPHYFGKSFMNWPPDPRSGPLTNITGTTSPSVSWFIAEILNGNSNVSALTNQQKGIYQVVSGVSGSKAWGSWTAATLKSYLTGTVGLSVGATSQKYERILRLFNRGYPGGPSAGAFSADWRARFFYNTDGATPLNDNTALWDSNGNWLVPCDNNGASGSNNNYRINYSAILAWIQQSASSPTTIFPAQVRSGGIKYYTSIPSSITTSTFPPSDVNQRFWKEFIDETLGLQQTALNGDGSPAYTSIINGTTCKAGIGPDYTLGTVQISSPPSSGTPVPYMAYGDNPLRWRTKGWFGPLNFIHFLQNWNQNRWWWSPTCTEAPTYQCKMGVQSAISSIQYNHPNDNVGLVYFSTPITGTGQGGSPGGGQFNTARVPLGQSYTLLTNSEWFHPHTIANPGTEFTPYDSYNTDGNMPRTYANGTCYSMGLMLAHNQLSSNTTLRTATKPTSTLGIAGGLGRIGASKLVIFETDGACKDMGSASLQNTTSPYNSYFNLVITDSTNPGGGGSYPINTGQGPGSTYGNAGSVTGSVGNWTVTSATGAPGDALNAASQMCALTSAGGLSTASKPVTIHCIAFGSLFDSANTSALKTTAQQLLHNMEVIGNVQPVSGGATPSSIASYKIILGSWSSAWPNPGRVQLMQQAFQTILEDGFQVILIATSTSLP